MASSIIATTIDENFPVAGIDNDSQGFRDNFSIIKDNFTFAKSEIEALQNNTAKINANNSFDNNTISIVNLKEVTHQLGTAVGSDDVSISFTGGHYQEIDNVSKDITVTITDWPNTNQYAEMFFHLSGNGGDTWEVTFASRNPAGTASTLHKDASGEWSGSTITLALTTSTSKVVKAWTYNGGLVVYLAFIGTFNPV